MLRLWLGLRDLYRLVPRRRNQEGLVLLKVDDAVAAHCASRLNCRRVGAPRCRPIRLSFDRGAGPARWSGRRERSAAARNSGPCALKVSSAAGAIRAGVAEDICVASHDRCAVPGGVLEPRVSAHRPDRACQHAHGGQRDRDRRPLRLLPPEQRCVLVARSHDVATLHAFARARTASPGATTSPGALRLRSPFETSCMDAGAGPVPSTTSAPAGHAATSERRRRVTEAGKICARP